MDKVRHAPLHWPLIGAALAFALSGGFGLGSLMAGGLAGWWVIGPWWGAVMQAHGHLQLFGWVGLFILGVALYFLPRLRGTPLAHADQVPGATGLLVSGLLLRLLAQPALALWPLGAAGGLARVALALSGLLFLGGTVIALHLLVCTARQGGPLRERPGFWSVLPLLVGALLSLVGAVLVNGWLSGWAAWRDQPLFPHPWNALVLHLMLYGFTLPVTLAFSVRTFPLFLRLAVPRVRAVWSLSFLYLGGFVLHGAGLALSISSLVAVGSIVEGVALLGTVSVLDVLTRLRPAWVVNRRVESLPNRRPTRLDLPDYGEYGRFEWLLYTAYLWLTLVALGHIGGSVLSLVGQANPVPTDAIRHALALGFITLLILGMGARMIPGFIQRRGVASPALVEATLWLGNGAALARVLPLLLPALPGARPLLGLSGLLGWFAVAALSLNLWRTTRPTPPGRNPRHETPPG